MTKDSRYMEDKDFPLCPLCEFGLYDAINEQGFNCTNTRSGHYTKVWDLPFENITSCNEFLFAVPAARKWVEMEVRKEEEKAQCTLDLFG